MNNNDRKKLEKALGLLSDAQSIIEEIKDGEQEKFDNLSEGLQQAEKGQQMESAVSTLEDALVDLESVMDKVIEASE